MMGFHPHVRAGNLHIYHCDYPILTTTSLEGELAQAAFVCLKKLRCWLLMGSTTEEIIKMQPFTTGWGPRSIAFSCLISG